MDRHPVDSGNIRSVGYDPETKTMEVEFGRPSAPAHQTTVYRYEGVETQEHGALLKAKSHGEHFAKHFKANKKLKVTKL